MVAFDTLADFKSHLIRKSIGGAAFVAPITAPAITSITTKTGVSPNEVIGLIELPVGWQSAGFLTNDGMAFSTETSTSDVESFSAVSPTRSDITSETSTLTLTMQQTMALSLELYTGALKAGMTPDAATGEVRIRKPQRPSSRSYRVLTLMVDGEGEDEIFIGRYLPRAKVTGKAEQAYSKTDAALGWGVTFTGFQDAEAGTSEEHFFGGAGWKKQLAAMGWE